MVVQHYQRAAPRARCMHESWTRWSKAPLGRSCQRESHSNSTAHSEDSLSAIDRPLSSSSRSRWPWAAGSRPQKQKGNTPRSAAAAAMAGSAHPGMVLGVHYLPLFVLQWAPADPSAQRAALWHNTPCSVYAPISFPLAGFPIARAKSPLGLKNWK
jgi:hypothetical protein